MRLFCLRFLVFMVNWLKLMLLAEQTNKTIEIQMECVEEETKTMTIFYCTIVCVREFESSFMRCERVKEWVWWLLLLPFFSFELIFLFIFLRFFFKFGSNDCVWRNVRFFFLVALNTRLFYFVVHVCYGAKKRNVHTQKRKKKKKKSRRDAKQNGKEKNEERK